MKYLKVTPTCQLWLDGSADLSSLPLSLNAPTCGASYTDGFSQPNEGLGWQVLDDSMLLESRDVVFDETSLHYQTIDAETYYDSGSEHEAANYSPSDIGSDSGSDVDSNCGSESGSTTDNVIARPDSPITAEPMRKEKQTTQTHPTTSDHSSQHHPIRRNPVRQSRLQG